jgi:hypothetical protein
MSAQILVALILFSVFAHVCLAAQSLTLKVVNQADAAIEFLWINTFDGSNAVKSIFNPVSPGDVLDMNTYEGHNFMCRFKDHNEGGPEKVFVKGHEAVERLRVTYAKQKGFTIEPISDEDYEVSEDMYVSKHAAVTDAVLDSTSTCADLRGQEYVTCVADGIFEDVNRVSDSKERVSKYWSSMVGRLRNYTCEDPNLESTEPISTYNFTSNDGKEMKIDTLLHMSHAKIWKIDNFISDEECDVLMKHGGPKLVRATVAGEGGESIVSESRKAQQAGYNLHQRNRDDPLIDLHNRVLSVTNHHANYNLKSPGQEDFTIIQYNPSDQYTPHCDGGCDGDPYNPGGRVATAVMYCKVADLGGATTFTKADIFVKPEKGTATFFSYKGHDGKMDEGYTEHSGCPVIEGEKWITTFWMREGVSAEEPWMSFDPRGVKMMEPDTMDIVRQRREEKKEKEKEKEKKEKEAGEDEL